MTWCMGGRRPVSLSHPRTLSTSITHSLATHSMSATSSPSSSFHVRGGSIFIRGRSRDVLRRIDRQAGGRYKLPANGRAGWGGAGREARACTAATRSRDAPSPTGASGGEQHRANLAGVVLSFIACFILLVIAPLVCDSVTE